MDVRFCNYKLYIFPGSSLLPTISTHQLTFSILKRVVVSVGWWLYRNDSGWILDLDSFTSCICLFSCFASPSKFKSDIFSSESSAILLGNHLDVLCSNSTLNDGNIFVRKELKGV